MTNPFDDTEGTFHVVVNDEGQHALWPTFADVPAGWEVVLEAAGREDALAYVELNWTDIRPKSLLAQYA
ncbi:MbtH family protein [Streptomyces sp. SR27]|uniref:MbtH family protein n=1 Tax=unclassified Streptomyces TaxID=2593676 RepID=UPI00295B598F|nr:MbtH family protein [Streptomyces sp. SR27]MDV9193233.1 MbtH family protein [Streptomyces sp. SR27]